MLLKIHCAWFLGGKRHNFPCIVGPRFAFIRSTRFFYIPLTTHSAAKNNKKRLKEVSNKTIIQKIQKLQNPCVRDCVFYALIVSRRHRLTEQRPSREKLLVTFTPRQHFHNKQTSPIWPILCWRGHKTLLSPIQPDVVKCPGTDNAGICLMLLAV